MTVSPTVGVAWGASGTATLTTASDGLRLASAGRDIFPWLNINRITITADDSVPIDPSEVTVTGANGASYGPVSISNPNMCLFTRRR